MTPLLPGHRTRIMSITPEKDYEDDMGQSKEAQFDKNYKFDDAFMLAAPRTRHSMAIKSIEQSFGDKQNLLSKLTQLDYVDPYEPNLKKQFSHSNERQGLQYIEVEQISEDSVSSRDASFEREE